MRDRVAVASGDVHDQEDLGTALDLLLCTAFRPTAAMLAICTLQTRFAMREANPWSWQLNPEMAVDAQIDFAWQVCPCSPAVCVPEIECPSCCLRYCACLRRRVSASQMPSC